MARKGQTGSTAGRKAEWITSPSTGQRLKVMFGQRWLCVQPGKGVHGGAHITAWVTQDDATYHRDRVGGDAYVEEAQASS
jgi:hypothetical protein